MDKYTSTEIKMAKAYLKAAAAVKNDKSLKAQYLCKAEEWLNLIGDNKVDLSEFCEFQYEEYMAKGDVSYYDIYCSHCPYMHETCMYGE